MTNFPIFDESSYRKTRRQIHALAKVIGRFRESLVEPIAKNDNLWLSVVDKGFCTPPMGRLNDLEIGCNLEELIIEIANDKNKYASVSVSGKSAGTLCSDIISILNDEFGIKAGVDPAAFDPAKEISIEVKDSQDFLLQFVSFNSLLKEFHKKINEGVKTQICIWPPLRKTNTLIVPEGAFLHDAD
ncbi:MAG: hypothetical protein IT281_09665 [Ignavibacteria bacterium]|nr:hypothetical protein [Ignavibacteria bacterium]